MSKCDYCVFYNYDDVTGEYVCDANIDEDDIERMMYKGTKDCPFFRDGDEYKTVRHQI